jgi:hypothetical protein
VAEAKRSGYTPSQLRKLLNECCTLWAAVERFKYAHGADLVATRQ